MIKTNYFKFSAFVAFALMLTTNVNAQDNGSQMERARTQQRVSQQKQIDSKSMNDPSNWVYSVAHVINKDGKIDVMFESTESKPKTDVAIRAMKMQEQRNSELKQAMNTFKSEVDVLNYFASQGLELVTIMPSNEKGGFEKLYYLRSRLLR